MEKNKTVLSVRSVSKKFSRSLRSSLWYGVKNISSELLFRRKERTLADLRKQEFWALKNVSFELKNGEALAIIGKNGAGKTTLLKLLYGLIRPDGGEIHIKGKLEAIIALHSGMYPILSGRENIYLKASVLGLSQSQISQMVEKIIDFAEIGEFIDSPVQFYSSGMAARLGFAISAHLTTDILLVDEVLAVGDINFQRKCINHMLDYVSSGGSLIFVSHTPSQIQSICNRGIILEQGSVVFDGTATEAITKYNEIENKSAKWKENESHDVNLSESENLVIKKVSIEPLSGDSIKTGESVEIVVNYSLLQNIDEVYWGFSISTSDNFVCVAGNINTTPTKLEIGKNDLRCLVPNLPLISGTYLLKISIIEIKSFYGLATLGWEDEPMMFKVHSSSDIVNNTFKSINQLVKLDVKW